jgi:ribosomal protein S27E
MTIIKATCPSCGDVELSRDQVRLVVHPLADRSFYGFTCTLCGDAVRKPAGGEVVRLLTMGGVVAERIVVPAEALERRTGPAISADDVLDFASWLSGAASVAEAAGAGLFRRLDGSSSTPTQA